MALEESVLFVRVGRPMLQSASYSCWRLAGVYRNNTRPVSSPVFFQACGMSRGMNAQVPGPPTVTSSPILNVNSPASTQATSSLS